jgi:hypothetical protein
MCWVLRAGRCLTSDARPPPTYRGSISVTGKAGSMMHMRVLQLVLGSDLDSCYVSLVSDDNAMGKEEEARKTFYGAYL